MTEDESRRPDSSSAPADLVRQLAAATERVMAGWTGPRMPFVPPATLSAQQLRAVLDDIAARRSQVEALRAQLGAFEEQLGALESALRPLLDWTEAWAGMEGAFARFWQAPDKK